MIVVTHEMGFARTAADRVRLHGRRRDRRGEHSRGVLHQPAESTGPRTSSARSSSTDRTTHPHRAGPGAGQKEKSMRFTKTKAVVAGLGLALQPGGLRRRRRRRRASTVEENPEFESGTTMAELAEAGEVTDRHQVRPARLRPARASRTSPRASTSRSPRSSPARWASPRRTSTWKETPSDIREQVDRGRRGRHASSRRTRSTTSASSGSPSPGPYYVAGQMLMVKADNDAITGPEDLKENPDAKVCSVTGLDPGG